MSVEKRELGGCSVAVVIVHPALLPPVRYKGRAWVRVGPTAREASPEDERRLAERRRALDAPFDLRPAGGATLSDVDLDHIERQYLPQAVAADVLEQNQRTLQEQMSSLRLMRQGSPTWGGLLAFGRDPQQWLPGAYIQFARFDGGDHTDPVKSQQVLAGRLEDVLSSLNRLLEINIASSIDVISGPREQRFPDYPIEALRQLAYNAVMHRNYEGTNAPSRVYWFSDRVEIESPGGLFGAVTPEICSMAPPTTGTSWSPRSWPTSASPSASASASLWLDVHCSKTGTPSLTSRSAQPECGSLSGLPNDHYSFLQ